MERNSHRTRVVITGMGIISPIGNTVAEAWENAASGKSGVGLIQRFDTSNLQNHIAGEVRNFDPKAYLSHRDVRRTDRVTHMAMAAAQQAIQDAGLEIDDDNRYDIGCLVGTGIGGLETLMLTARTMYEKGPRAISPFAVTMSVPDSPCSQIAIHYGLRGPVFAISTACATGNNSIGEATEIIRRGGATVMLAGSSETGVTDVSIASFSNMNAISKRNDAPEKASRPFDIDRDGFVPSEGAAVLVLEELGYALNRGAKIYGEILGYGHTTDAFHVTAPLESGESAARAITLALKNAGLTPEDLDYINAHGTSTPLNDKAETLALKLALGETAYRVPISSTKSMTGHMMAGAASVEAVVTLMAMHHGFVPPTINLDTPDPDCDLNYTPNKGVAHKIDIAMSNAFGFGGHNAVLVLGRYNS